MSQRIGQILKRLHEDKGAAAVSFILALPIFLLIVAILVQYALMANAKVMIDHAAQMAARAAVTSLPEDHPENVRSAAYMALAPLSPQAKTAENPDATSILAALQGVGVPVPDTFAARYTYALAATEVNWDPPPIFNAPTSASPAPINFVKSPGQEIDVTVIYRFYLTVPGAMRLIGSEDTVAGVHGRFLDITSTCRVQTAHGREAVTDGNGWPQ